MKNRLLGILLTSLLLVITLSFSIIPLSAADQSISEIEAQNLIYNALDFFHNIHWARDSVHFDSREPMIRFDEYDASYFELYEENLPGGSYEAMKEYAKTIYVDELASNMYSHSRSAHNAKPMFVKTVEGKICIHPPCTQANVLSWGAGETTWQLYGKNDMTIKLIRGNSKYAVAYLKIIYGNEIEADYYWIECKMINTANGWRIEDSPFTLMLEWGENGYNLWKDGLIPYEASPSTGDTAGERVAVIGAVSLACIIPTACLMRRRRRRDTI